MPGRGMRLGGWLAPGAGLNEVKLGSGICSLPERDDRVRCALAVHVEFPE